MAHTTRISRTPRFVGLDVGGTTAKAVETDQFGRPLGKMVAVKLPGKRPKDVIGSCKTLLKRLQGRGGSFSHIGLSICGLVDNGRLVFAPNLPHCVGTDFSKPFGGAVVRNDADCGAAMEASLLPGYMNKTVCCLFPGSGLGGAVVQNGRIYSGFRGAAQELGHVPCPTNLLVLPWFPMQLFGSWSRLAECGCGRSFCTEAIVSLRRGIPTLLSLQERCIGIKSFNPLVCDDALIRRMRNSTLIRQWNRVRHYSLTHPDQEAVVNSVRDYAQMKNPDVVATNVFHVQAQALGLLAVTVSAIVSPHQFIIGGGWADTKPKFRRWLMTTIRQTFSKHVRQTPLRRDQHRKVRVDFSWTRLGEESQACGAALMAAQIR